MSEYLLNVIVKDKIYDDIKLKRMKLGLDVLIVNIPKYIILLLVSLYLDIFVYTLIMCIVFAIIRSTSFGIHANTCIGCMLSTLTLFIGGIYASRYLYISKIIYIMTYFILLILYYRFAPADTKKHPLLNKRHRESLKNRTLVNLTVLLIIGFIIKDHIISNIFLIANVYQAILILPITYKILGRSYRNYDVY